MLVLLQPRIAVGRKHFTVRIDVDPPAFGLDQQPLQIVEVVAGNQNRLARHRRHAHFGRLRFAETGDVMLVQQLHRQIIHAAALQNQSDQFLRRNPFRQRPQRPGQKRVDLRVGSAEPPRMVIIRRHPLEAVQQKFTQLRGILAQLLQPPGEFILPAQLQQSGGIDGQFARNLRGHPATEFGNLLRIEVHIGHSSEQGVRHQAGFGSRTLCGPLLQQFQQQVLHCRAFVTLAANAGAQLAAGSA